jgi:hypothetical protein
MAQDTFDVLAKVVSEVECLPGWTFHLQDEDGALRLVITLDTRSNFDFEKRFRVAHFHPVPITTYNEKSWRRWVFEQCRRTMNHELGEALRFNGERPFRPLHGPGEDPYTVHEYRPEADARTLQDGTIMAPRRTS